MNYSIAILLDEAQQEQIHQLRSSLDYHSWSITPKPSLHLTLLISPKTIQSDLLEVCRPLLNQTLLFNQLTTFSFDNPKALALTIDKKARLKTIIKELYLKSGNLKQKIKPPHLTIARRNSNYEPLVMKKPFQFILTIQRIAIIKSKFTFEAQKFEILEEINV